MSSWINDISDAADSLGVEVTGNWRNNVKAISTALQDYSSGGATGSASWGSIGGTLSNQTDLAAALEVLSSAISTINGEIDAIDTLIEESNDALDDIDSDVTSLMIEVGVISTDLNNLMHNVVTGSETTLVAADNTSYYFGEIASLVVTLPTVTDTTMRHEIIFVFTSGTSPTSVSLPSDVNINGLVIEASKTYVLKLLYVLGTWVVTY